MNKHILSLMAVGTLVSIVPLCAYTYKFSNHTNFPMQLRLKLNGIDESWEYRLLWPRGTVLKIGGIDVKADYVEFAWTGLGSKTPSISPRKVGFCLQDIQIATVIMEKQRIVDDEGNVTYKKEIKIDPNTKLPMLNPWRNVSPKWIKSEAYDRIVAAGVQFADGAVDLARAAITLITGIPVPEFKISGIFSAIGEWAGRSLCADRHFDIIQDADTSLDTDNSYVFLVEARA